METTTSTQIKVGIFLTIGLVLVGVSIFFLGGSQALKKQYYLKARFSQVQGLAEGSIVTLAGIKVGNIIRIDFLGDKNTIEITLKIEESFKNRITVDSKVDIRTQGALGDKYIYIEPGSPGSVSLENNNLIPSAEGSDIFSVISQKADKATMLFDILEDIHIITKTLTHENRIDRIVNSIEGAAKNSELTLKESHQLMSTKLASSVDKLDKILTRIEKGEGTLGALVNDSSLHEQLKSVLGGSKRTQNMKNILRKSIEE